MYNFFKSYFTEGKTNVAHLLVAEGIVSVRRENVKAPETTQLTELEDIAKLNNKGKWNSGLNVNTT